MLRKSLRTLGVLVVSAIACFPCGCVFVPSGMLADRSPTPPRQLAGEIKSKRVVAGETSVETVVSLLANREIPPGQHGVELHVWDDPSSPDVVILYDELDRAFGITLNSHVLFLPMPLVGQLVAGESPTKALLLKSDAQGRFISSKCGDEFLTADFDLRGR